MLADEEKRLLRRLSVFAGTFSLDAAIEICCFDFEKSLAIELLAGLVSKSLVTSMPAESTLRYGMLDTTKSYCWKKLRNGGEDIALIQRFSAFCSTGAQQYAGKSLTKEELDPVSSELPNLRAALEWYFREGGLCGGGQAGRRGVSAADDAVSRWPTALAGHKRLLPRCRRSWPGRTSRCIFKVRSASP